MIGELIQWPNMQILFKFQVNRMKIDDFMWPWRFDLNNKRLIAFDQLHCWLSFVNIGSRIETCRRLSDKHTRKRIYLRSFDFASSSLLAPILLSRVLELPKQFFLGDLAQSWTGRHSDHFLEHSCAPLPVQWYSFCWPQEDDRLSQPHLVLIQQSTWLKLRTPGSQASHANH